MQGLRASIVTHISNNNNRYFAQFTRFQRRFLPFGQTLCVYLHMMLLLCFFFTVSSSSSSLIFLFSLFYFPLLLQRGISFSLFHSISLIFNHGLFIMTYFLLFYIFHIKHFPFFIFFVPHQVCSLSLPLTFSIVTLFCLLSLNILAFMLYGK